MQTTPEQRRARLAELRERIKAAPVKAERGGACSFNMHVFGDRSECGTVACAAGHAVLMPSFAAAGGLVEWDRLHALRASFHGVGDLREWGSPADAAAAFLGLSEKEAEALFYEWLGNDDDYSDDGPSPEQVRDAKVAEIDALIEATK